MTNNKYEHKENKGSLFKNNTKQTDSHPDYKGSCNINGVSMWVSAWETTSKSGMKYINLSFSPVSESESSTYSNKNQIIENNSIEDDYDDEIPF